MTDSVLANSEAPVSMRVIFSYLRRSRRLMQAILFSSLAVGGEIFAGNLICWDEAVVSFVDDFDHAFVECEFEEAKEVALDELGRNRAANQTGELFLAAGDILFRLNGR